MWSKNQAGQRREVMDAVRREKMIHSSGYIIYLPISY